MSRTRTDLWVQLDMEMSFAGEEEVMSTIEGLLRELWHELLGEEIASKFQRMTYDEAMSSYGSDKPDLRYQAKVVLFDRMRFMNTDPM